MADEYPWTEAHLAWLSDSGDRPQTENGKSVEIWHLVPNMQDDEVISLWARHIRCHYCTDEEVDELRQGTGMTREEYLHNLQFPDASIGFGPSVRAGDFSEIIIADQLEHFQRYWVPRVKFCRKAVRNQSPRGSDLIGIKTKTATATKDDELIIVEVKAMLSGNRSTHPLQDAIEDSVKDEVRKAESLNAIKQRFIDAKKLDKASRIERFQNPLDKPYMEVSGAAAVISSELFQKESIGNCDTSFHPNSDHLRLLAVVGSDLMSVAHEMFRRAASEA